MITGDRTCLLMKKKIKINFSICRGFIFHNDWKLLVFSILFNDDSMKLPPLRSEVQEVNNMLSYKK